MFAKFLPKTFNFFDLFDKQIACAVDAAACFKGLVAKLALDEADLQKMRDIEHQGDDVCHDIIAQLNKTFITPIDREDIHALAKEIDDVTDMLHAITNRLRVYNLGGGDKHLIEFSVVIEVSVKEVARAINGLRNMKNHRLITEACVEVNRLENVGDSMRDAILQELFEKKAKEPIAVIKWKEIYEQAETVLDICEDIAHIVESIMVKQA